MAANGDNNDHGAEGQWLFDPLLVPDDLDDVMHLLNVPADDDQYSPPPPASTQNVAADGSYSGNPLDGTAMAGNVGAYSSVDSTAHPAAVTAMAGGSSTSAHQDVGASSSYVHQGVLDCTGCQMLREIMHIKGLETTKLCIHGVPGLFYHATLEVYHANNEGLALEPTHQSFVDFIARDYAWVKHYLIEYAQKRAAGGYTVVHDSTSDFLDVLCTSMAGVCVHADDNGDVAAPAEAENGVAVDEQIVPADSGDAVQPMIAQEEILPDEPGPSELRNDAVDDQEEQVVQPHARSTLAIQRERTSKLERRDIACYFHLPMEEACKKLQVCGTVLKGVSRKFGLKRWPYRMINKIDNKIAKLRENGDGSAESMAEIQKLTDSRREIIDGPSKEI